MEDSQVNKALSDSRVNPLAIIMFLIIFVPSSFHPLINSISLYVLIPLLFLYSVIKNPGLIFNYKPLFFLLLLLCWSLLTMIKSKDLNLSFIEIKQLAGVFFLCYIFVYYSFVNTKYIFIFYFLYILKFFTIVYYAYTQGIFGSIERFNLAELNANTFGYYGFFSIVSAFFLWQFMRNNLLVRISLIVLFGLCLSLSLVSCFLAASRAGIAISIITATILIMIYFFYPFSKKVLIGIIFLIFIGIAIVPVLNSYYEGSILEKRMQIVNMQDESRFSLVKRALEVGFKNPIYGVGPGNFILYSGKIYFSHSTYTELLANNGLIALILFISILYYYFKKNRHFSSLGKDYSKNALYFYSFILLYSFYNLFYVFHTQLFMLGFLYIVLVQLETFIYQTEN